MVKYHQFICLICLIHLSSYYQAKIMKAILKISHFIKALTVSAMLGVYSLANANVVSVSNYPLLLLSNAVTKGGKPAQMLLSSGDVGHHGSLSPSKVKLVKDSRFVVWFGQELEQNLVNTLQNAPNAIALYRFNAFHRLPMRNIDGTVRPNTFDPHLWLNPANAKAIVRALAVIHGYADPTNKSLYHQNAQNFAKELDRAVLAISPKKMPYWAYHDAYQYLEKPAQLHFVGALTPDHHLAPKASQIKYLNTNRPQTSMCLVSQQPVSDGILSKLGKTSVVLLQEDLSEYDDFVQAWVASVQKIYQCT